MFSPHNNPINEVTGVISTLCMRNQRLREERWGGLFRVLISGFTVHYFTPLSWVIVLLWLTKITIWNINRGRTIGPLFAQHNARHIPCQEWDIFWFWPLLWRWDLLAEFGAPGWPRAELPFIVAVTSLHTQSYVLSGIPLTQASVDSVKLHTHTWGSVKLAMSPSSELAAMLPVFPAVLTFVLQMSLMCIRPLATCRPTQILVWKQYDFSHALNFPPHLEYCAMHKGKQFFLNYINFWSLQRFTHHQELVKPPLIHPESPIH